jgi:aminopeptidase N
MSKDVKRLFAEFQPEHYTLELTPDRDAKKFKGRVRVRGRKVGRPSQRLTFHQKGLKFTDASVTKHDKKGDVQIAVDRINTHDSFDEVRLHAGQMVYPGEYTVTIDFKGQITRNMNGIYPCFFEQGGKEKELVATQFESHHAREVFPCVDEPEAKATFDLMLTTPKGETVLANTPAKEAHTKGSQTTTTFETTPKMSTYLLAFAYGELGYKEAKTASGVTVRTYATPDNVQFTDFALDTAVKALDFYTEYFGIPYPLPKCDMIALPDFASGAMENWGLITYREQTLLVDPANTSLATRQYVAMVVAHELAHMWFGNLVTMRWWTDLWLNEGFASWVEYLAVDHLFPEWEMWTQFAVDEQLRAFKLDALENTHPVEVPVHHPDEIRTIFDTISYSKGASVIHMLNQYLGADTFKRGLQHYLTKHKYGNTDTVDLWAALEEKSGKPVKQFMHAWTSQSGFPLFGASIEGDTVSLHQERFYLNPEQSKKASTTWPIPLLSGSGDLPGITGQKETKFEITDASSLKLNRGQSGFYRTVYNREHLARLGELISSGQLEPLDRLGILSDVFEAAKAGKASTVDALEFLRYFEDENNSAVWDVISAGVVATRAVMDDEDLRELMKPYIRRLVGKQLNRLGWEKKEAESHFDQLLRPLILSLASHADEPAVVGEALRRFDAATKPEEIDPDLRGVIYGTAVRQHDDKKTFDKLFKMHENSVNSEERTTIAAALTGFKSKELIQKALGIVKTDSVRHQDVAYWVAYSLMNRHAKRLAWKWMTKEWDWLEKNLGSDLSFYRFPVYAANAFSERKFLDEYKKFFEPKIAPAIERSIKQGIEILTWQSAWKERDFADVKTFFQERQ